MFRSSRRRVRKYMIKEATRYPFSAPVTSYFTGRRSYSTNAYPRVQVNYQTPTIYSPPPVIHHTTQGYYSPPVTNQIAYSPMSPQYTSQVVYAGTPAMTVAPQYGYTTGASYVQYI